MASFQVAYVPIGVPTFHIESAQKEYERSRDMLTSLTQHLVFPENILLCAEDLAAFLETISPDLVILQNSTFANGVYCGEILKRFSCPLLLWTLREPVIDGSRLRLNSLTGAYSAGNVLNAFGREFEYTFGSPGEQEVQSQISAFICAGAVKHKLGESRIATVGHTPVGFGFGRALDSELLSTFGVALESLEIRELTNKARMLNTEDFLPLLEAAKQATYGLCEIPEENQIAFARLYKAYSDYVAENKISAISSRCWPELFTEYGTPVCAVLSLLNDNGVAASCESDVCGSISVLIGMLLSNRPTFFGDPVSLDEKENTLTYWHCGMAPCSLARKDTGATIGVHPNRKIGPVMDFGCAPCESVTVFRVGRKRDGNFRFFIAQGRALDKPKQFDGTSTVVRMHGKAKDIVINSVKDGWEPHFTIIFDSVSNELEMLGKMLNIETTCY